jgi:DNA-binding transcriptional regulator GbsR (MarR family)
MEPEHPSEDLVNFVDELGLFYEDNGQSRIAGRVLGWLLVCEPEYQSAEDIANILHASRGSISTTTRTLIRAGMVERRTFGGDRRTYYQVRPGAWTAMLEDPKHNITRLRKLTDVGLELLNGESDERRRRLEEMRDLLTFFEREFPTLMERWRREHQSDN